MRIFILIVLFIFLTGCTACIKKPTPIMDKDKKMSEPISCYYYRECEYYKTVDKKSSGDCKAEFIKCCKDLDYRYCQDAKNLPPSVNFGQCFDKLQ